MMSKFKSIVGYTLIELMFVVAIASVLATLGLSMVQQHGKRAKVEKTALQMKQLIQAGLAYYADNNCWPVSSGSSSGCKTTPPFSNYSPIAGTMNPWGFTYEWGVRGKLFEVWTNTPDPNAANPPIAQLIAGALPSAVTGSGGACGMAYNCVYAQTTMQTQGLTSPSMYVVAFGTLNKSNGNTVDFKCLPGYSSRIQVALRDYNYAYETGRSNGSISYTAPYPIKVVITYKPQPVDSTSKSGYKYYDKIGINSISYGRLCSAVTVNIVPGTAIGVFYCNREEAMKIDSENFHILRGSALFDSYTLDYTIYCYK